MTSRHTLRLDLALLRCLALLLCILGCRTFGLAALALLLCSLGCRTFAMAALALLGCRTFAIAGLVLLLRVRGCHVLDSLLEACDLVLKLQPLLRGYIQRVQVVLDFLL